MYFKLELVYMFFFFLTWCLYTWLKWSLHVLLHVISLVSVVCEKHELTHGRVPDVRVVCVYIKTEMALYSQETIHSIDHLSSVLDVVKPL